jgi:hypothetical protein
MKELSASTAGRDLSLLIKMSPPVVTTETLKGGQTPLIQFRLSDMATNETMKHVTYLIEIEKSGKRLMLDTFPVMVSLGIIGNTFFLVFLLRLNENNHLH